MNSAQLFLCQPTLRVWLRWLIRKSSSMHVCRHLPRTAPTSNQDLFLPALLIGESPYRAATDDAQVGRHQIRVIGLVLANRCRSPKPSG